MRPYNPYLDMLLWPTPDAATIAKEAGLKAMTLAFLVADQQRKALCWGGQSSYPIEWVHDQCRALIKANVAYDLSIGGATGQDIAAGLDAGVAADAYATAWMDLGPRYLDFDIEGAAVASVLQHKIRLDAINQANEILSRQMFRPIKYTMTLAVMPEGLPADALELIDLARDSAAGAPAEIRIMAMDYGSSYVDMGVSAIKAAEAASKQVGQPVVVVPMIGQNDIAEEVFTLYDAQMLASYAAEHPKVVAGLSAWSLGRDNECHWMEEAHLGVEASPRCSGVGQEPYEFSGILSEND